MILWNHGVRDAHEPGQKSRILPSHIPQPVSPPRTGQTAHESRDPCPVAQLALWPGCQVTKVRSGAVPQIAGGSKMSRIVVGVDGSAQSCVDQLPHGGACVHTRRRDPRRRNHGP
jgi:hypothetical protein